ncbi:Uncharacterised protein [Megamonas hypermegale]|uniref:DUF4127 family protein n=1 Tax=Megamonas hypermegale TaxID=158847 RepID=A0A378NR58_9FIRM|nr:DUF4127 family protein [Megamonas hypermegale]STY70356.1 Uncharacterised protein [Megamonas hypermegale]
MQFKYLKQLLCLFLMMIVVYVPNVVFASLNKTIIFVPHDNRPISFKQTADNIRDLGYEVLTPPEELLGNRENPYAKPEELSKWVIENAKKADAAVISSDSMVYGSLVASRKHNLSEDVVLARVHNFEKIHQTNPNMKLYVFGSIMRTPQTSEASGSEDANYYAQYGTDIARYTALTDKLEQDGLTHKERKRLQQYEQKIPKAALDDWLSRRQGNFLVSKNLIDLARNDVITYLALGCDDNAKYSQTNKERRALDNYGSDLGELKYQSVAGIDEIGYVLLTRAVNNLQGDIPFVSVHYAKGTGENTIPAYSNEPIKNSIATHIKMAGGMKVNSDKRADLVFMVNTNFDGTTGAANDLNNVYIPNENIIDFVNMVDEAVQAGKKVGIGDITFGNGSDNALMFSLYGKNLLDKLNAYSGWNTPTNSTGYALAMGMGANYTDRVGILKMLEVRYLDDWLYQANIRQAVANRLNSMPGEGDYGNTKTRTLPAEKLATEALQKMIADYGLEKFEGQSYVADAQIRFPWQRMFEADIVFPEEKVSVEEKLEK